MSSTPREAMAVKLERTSSYDMTPVEDALTLVLNVAGEAASASPNWTETVALSEVGPTTLLGRRLAEDVVALDHHPPFRASIMDGYAVIAADGPGTYPVVQSVTAGSGRHDNACDGGEGKEPEVLSPGHVSYITTGAPVPPGADAVVRVEDTEEAPTDMPVGGKVCESPANSNGSRSSKDPSAWVSIKTSVPKGKWIREIGSDVKKGSTVIPKGTVLGPAEIGLLASVGATTVCLRRRPVIGIMSTGDELVEANKCAPGALRSSQSVIRDSNRPMLMSAAHTTGALVIDLGIAPDKEDLLRSSLLSALERVDILVTSGGVSMGSKDYIKPIVSSIKGSKIHFGRVRMKPGKPATFASIHVNTATSPVAAHKLLFALPGNPVSSLVTFQLFVDPAVRRLLGFATDACHHSRVQARLAHSLPIDPVRREYHRATLEWRQGSGSPGVDKTVCGQAGRAGEFVAMSTGIQRSSRLLSMVTASALLCLPRATTKRRILPAGTIVSALLLNRGVVPPLSVTIPHVDDYVEPERASVAGTIRTATEESEKKEDPGEEEEEEVTCPCCRAAGRSSRSKKYDDTPPPLSGGSLNVVGGQPIRIGVLTVSDRASRGEYADRGGPEVLRCVARQVKSLWTSDYRVVSDDMREIETAICDLCDRSGCHIIVTTGGTGSSPRDVTPDATEKVCDRMFPGFGEMMRSISLRYVPTAILSRQTAGLRGTTLIINLPGNPGSIGQILPSVIGPAAHCINLAGGPLMEVAEMDPSLTAANVSSPSAAINNLPAPQNFTLDAANIAWIKERMKKSAGPSTASSIVACVMRYTMQASVDQSVVFTKKRGCGRKKKKEIMTLSIEQKTLDYLNSAVRTFDLPDLGKAIRIVLDYAMEEDGVEALIFVN
eukprot:g3624.t1